LWVEVRAELRLSPQDVLEDVLDTRASMSRADLSRFGAGNGAGMGNSRVRFMRVRVDTRPVISHARRELSGRSILAPCEQEADSDSIRRPDIAPAPRPASTFSADPGKLFCGRLWSERDLSSLSCCCTTVTSLSLRCWDNGTTWVSRSLPTEPLASNFVTVPGSEGCSEEHIDLLAPAILLDESGFGSVLAIPDE